MAGEQILKTTFCIMRAWRKTLVLNITYNPAYSTLKSILLHIHVLLTPNKERQYVFQSIPTVEFKMGKSLYDILLRATLSEIKSGKGQS